VGLWIPKILLSRRHMVHLWYAVSVGDSDDKALSVRTYYCTMHVKYSSRCVNECIALDYLDPEAQSLTPFPVFMEKLMNE